MPDHQTLPAARAAATIRPFNAKANNPAHNPPSRGPRHSLSRRALASAPGHAHHGPGAFRGYDFLPSLT